MQTVILRPIITEKSMADAGKGRYLFAVSEDATKKDIKKYVNQKFNVHVMHITTSVVKGKRKRVGARKQEVHDSVWKKAVVRVKKGEKIGLFEGGDEEKK